MFESTETVRRDNFLEIFWYHVNGHVFNFPNLEKNSAASSSIMEKNAKNWKNRIFEKTFLDVIFMNNNVWLRFIYHNKRLEILHRLIYHTIYNTWILKTFFYNNRWKLQTAISRHYRNLEGYGNWKFFITRLDLYAKKNFIKFWDGRPKTVRMEVRSLQKMLLLRSIFWENRALIWSQWHWRPEYFWFRWKFAQLNFFGQKMYMCKNFCDTTIGLNVRFLSFFSRLA
jgi:hypothetical protein